MIVLKSESFIEKLLYSVIFSLFADSSFFIC